MAMTGHGQANYSPISAPQTVIVINFLVENCCTRNGR